MSESGPPRANIELKARCPDREKAESVCERLGAELVHVEVQTDHYFSVGAYRMKLRESSLGEHWLVFYNRPNEPGTRKSSYRLVPVPDPVEKRRILSKTMPVKAVVRKERTLLMLGPVRIHLDRVDDLGDFLEFEAVLGDGFGEKEGHREVARLRQEFGIAEEDLISGSYSDLLRLRGMPIRE